MKNSRRSFLTNAAMMLAASELANFGLAYSLFTNNNKKEIMKSNDNESKPFGPIKQINAGLLNIGYAEFGSPNRSVVILLHGWPYDIHTYTDVASLLESAGYRV